MYTLREAFSRGTPSNFIVTHAFNNGIFLVDGDSHTLTSNLFGGMRGDMTVLQDGHTLLFTKRNGIEEAYTVINRDELLPVWRLTDTMRF